MGRAAGWIALLVLSLAQTVEAQRRPRADPEAAGDDTTKMATGVRAHRDAAERVLEALKRDPGLPMITLPRIPTAEIGPAIIAELTPHLAEQLR